MTKLYHYCSAETFLAILTGKSIRCSSLAMTNDSMEGRLAWQQFERLPELRDAPPETREFFFSSIGPRPESIEALGFCLSEAGDVLSQWRGYADDGRGVSIGFSKEYLQRLCKSASSRHTLNLEPVVYEPLDHTRKVERIFAELKALLASGRTEASDAEADLDRRYHVKRYEFYRNAFTFKSPVFREEREWRLMAYLGGAAAPDICYRAQQDKFVPFLTLDIANLGCPPILEVVLGPKHTSSDGVIRGLLSSTGFPDAIVTRSSASYR
jgi:Protein of unknown function (DUF2971)